MSRAWKVLNDKLDNEQKWEHAGDCDVLGDNVEEIYWSYGA
jgi:hypothetical protein